MLNISNLSAQNLAKIAAIYSGMMYGIYWIPLRVLDQNGFPGIWATAVFNIVTCILVIPVIVAHWHRFFPGRRRFHLMGFVGGLGYAFYSTAFVYTEVVSAVAIFYLMPIWGFLFARFFIGDPITPVRWLSMAIALVGLMVILGHGLNVPVPKNSGDWMALASGILWAGMGLMILVDQQEKSVDIAAGFILWGTIISVISALFVTHSGFAPGPHFPEIWSHVKWLLPFAMIVILPAAVATMYGPSKLNPGVVGLLFMTEISVGVITAALWAEEPFGFSQIAGVAMITLAGVLETACLFIKKDNSVR